MMNFETIRAMTTTDIRNHMRELSTILEGDPMSEDWDAAYGEYNKCEAVLNERYIEENQEKFDAYYEKNIKGKRWEDIDPESWQFYSDWHKDMYGFRPRVI